MSRERAGSIEAMSGPAIEAAGALMTPALHSGDTQNAILSGGAPPQLVSMLSNDGSTAAAAKTAVEKVTHQGSHSARLERRAVFSAQ